MGKLVVLNVRLLAYALLEARYKFFNLHAHSKGAGEGFSGNNLFFLAMSSSLHGITMPGTLARQAVHSLCSAVPSNFKYLQVRVLFVENQSFGSGYFQPSLEKVQEKYFCTRLLLLSCIA